MFLHVSVILSTGGGWYPSMSCRSPGPHPGGRLRGLAGGSPGPHPGGKLKGLAFGGWPGPHPGRRLRGPAGGSPGPHPRGSPGPHPWGVSQHALRQTPPADGFCCGQYASYWNAFLFYVCKCQMHHSLHQKKDKIQMNILALAPMSVTGWFYCQICWFLLHFAQMVKLKL